MRRYETLEKPSEIETALLIMRQRAKISAYCFKTKKTLGLMHSSSRQKKQMLF
jgi:hypothetical protein